MPTANGGGKRPRTARRAWTTLPAQRVRHLPVGSTWCLSLGSLGCAETTSLCPVFLLTLTLRTAFACRAQGCEHAADDVAARTPLPALAVSSPLHLRRFTAGNLRCAADCRRSVLRFAPYRSSIVAAGWTVRHSVALLKVSGMAVCSRRHPTASARS